jgi:hypothetical protein
MSAVPFRPGQDPRVNYMANLKSAQNLAANQTGVRGEFGEIRSDLTYEQRAAYNKALSAIILRNPSIYPPGSVTAAQRVSIRGYEELSDLGTGAAVGVFFKEVGRQVADLNETFNPLSEKSRRTTRNLLLIGGAIALFIYFGPALLEGSRKLKSSFK